MLSRKWLVAILALLVVSIAFRGAYLTSIPGMNGDEACGGVWAKDFLAGKAPFAWITNTNRPIPLYMGLLTGLHLLASPSYLLLRAVACLLGVLTIVATYVAARSIYARSSTVWVVTLLAACVPIQIAYSRTAWDPAMTSLAPLMLLTFLLRGQPVWAAAGLLLGFIIHPLAVFFAPYVAICFIADILPRYLPRRGHRLLVLAGVALAALPIARWGYTSFMGMGGTGLRWQLWGMRSLWQFVGVMGGIFSGSTPYSSFVHVSNVALLDAGAVLAMASVPIIAVVCLKKRTLPARRRLYPLGVLLSLLLYYLANPTQDAAHDRYCLVFVLPVVLMWGLALDEMTERRAVWLSTSTAALLLVGFASFYFGGFFRTGGPPGETYETGPVEPKLAANEWILADARGAETNILVDSWWVYWPIVYLNYDNARVHVYHVGVPDAAMPRQGRVETVAQLQALMLQGSYGVGLSKGLFSQLLPKLPAVQQCAGRDIAGFAGKAVVTVRKFCPKG